MLSRLFLLCSVLTSALCCDWLRHYGHLSNESRTFLELMGGQLTEEEPPLSFPSFPSRLYRRIENSSVESQLVFIRDSLRMMSRLYRHDNLSSSNWDPVKTEHFLTVLHRQTEELSSCVSTKTPTDVRLRRYYRRLDCSTASRTGGSTVSWELLRRESRLHLDQLELLVNSIRAAAAAAASRRSSAASL